MLTRKIKNTLEEEGPLICIGLLILPILFAFYNSYFGSVICNVWTEDYPYLWLLLVTIVGGRLSFIQGKKVYLVAFLPIVFYLIQAVGVTNKFWQQYLEYGALLLTIISFSILAIKGHVRSWAFLIFLIFCLLFYSNGFVVLLGMSYLFIHFVVLVLKDNFTVFTTLGKEKSLKFLGRSLLYWSPMLLLILPLRYCQEQIENELDTQIYTQTLVDSTEFLFQQELTDSLFNDLIPSPNKTTVLFVVEKPVDSTILKKESVFTEMMSALKYKVINQIGEKRVLVEDTVAYDIITHVLPKYHSVQGQYENIYLNEVFSNADETTNSDDDYDVITSMNAKGKLELPLMIVLQDLSYGTGEFNVDELQPNMELSSLVALKRMELSMIESIEKEAGEVDFSSLANLDKVGKGALEGQRKKLVGKIEGHQGVTNKAADKQIDAFLPEPLLELEKCKFWQVGKLIANEIRRNVNGRYSKEKKKIKSKIKSKIDKAYLSLINKVNFQFKNAAQKMEDIAADIDTEQLAKGTTDISAMISKEVKNAVDEAALELMDQYRLIFGGLFFYSLIGAIAFYFLVIQTFLYIFARISISKENNLYASLNASGQVLPKGSIKKCGDTYTIKESQKQIYYVSRIYEPSGRPPRFTVPFKGISVYRRLKSRAYTMNKIDMNKGNGAVQFRAIGSSEFVEWTLKEGEEVVFDYRNFVAISDTVALKSVVSFRVTTLLLGSVFYQVAQGPGKLILMTKGRPVVSGEATSNDSLAQNRILAWNKGTNFDIDTELGLTDVYLSGFYLQKMPKDLIVIDADAKGKANLGLIQYIKGLIWPF